MFRNFNRRYVGGFLIFSGCGCLVVALVTFFFARHFVGAASHAQGKILRMLEQRSHDGESTVYYPVFTFRDAQGVEHTIHSSWGSFPPAYEVGDSVPILYSSSDPEDAKIDRIFSVWGWPLITGILASTYLPIGLVMWFWPEIVKRFRRGPMAI